MRRFLHITAVALALLFCSVSRSFPPAIHAQSPVELERHIDSTDGNVKTVTGGLERQWAAMADMRKLQESDHTDLAVLEGKIGLLESIGGAILLAVLGNLAISWKGRAGK